MLSLAFAPNTPLCLQGVFLRPVSFLQAGLLFSVLAHARAFTCIRPDRDDVYYPPLFQCAAIQLLLRDRRLLAVIVELNRLSLVFFFFFFSLDQQFL